MSGEADYLLRVVVPDVASLEKLTIDHLSRIPGVANIQSSFALKEVKSHSPLPVL
jgi:Lrp/AsnC family leucine-responsive transcriptional regulator